MKHPTSYAEHRPANKNTDGRNLGEATTIASFYYSPERPFLYAYPKPKLVNFQLYSGGESIEGVATIGPTMLLNMGLHQPGLQQHPDHTGTQSKNHSGWPKKQ